MVEERFIRNIGAITATEQQKLAGSRVFLAGCGGLGGYVLEYLARVGVGHIICADDGVFERSNLNRQLLCVESNMGRKKTDCARERAKSICPGIDITAVDVHLDSDTLPGLLQDCDLAMDATDNIDTRAELFTACCDSGVPLVFGAAQGWNAAAAFVPPTGELYKYLQENATTERIAADISTLAFVPAFAAAMQTALAVKFLCGMGVDGRLHVFDMLEMKAEVVGI